jgi:para-aminobenzoate synthetase component 1
VHTGEPEARFGDVRATDLLEVADDLRALEAGGRWVVAVGFEGQVTLARFGRWEPAEPPPTAWSGVRGPWRTSLDQPAYTRSVREIQAEIARGWVYQVNLCRVLSADCDAGAVLGLYARLAEMNGAFAGLLDLPEHGVHIASASPERFLSLRGSVLKSSPIKGTAASPSGFLAKDRAENVMIVDLVRNDLGRLAEVGTVAVEQLVAVEPYPGLYHLVSTIAADIGHQSWPDVFTATFPPGSVSGAPKSSALEVIARVEPCPRQWYCGAFGWIDADTRRAELGVAIRTFWLDDMRLRFGTGAGITWDSDPDGEWQETQLKARRLIALADLDSVTR